MRRKARRLAAALTAAALTAVPALAEGEGPAVVREGNSYTVTYQGEAGRDYLLLALRTGADPKALEVGDILYIDQARGDETGLVLFENIRPSVNQDFRVYLSGTDQAGETVYVDKVIVSGEASHEGISGILVSAVDEDGIPARSVEIGVDGSFSVKLATSWTYTLSVTKKGHTPFQTTLTAGDENIDLGEVPLLAGDVNGDGKIDGQDLSALLYEYDREGGELSADFNETGAVNVEDLSLLLRNYGKGEEAGA